MTYDEFTALPVGTRVATRSSVGTASVLRKIDVDHWQAVEHSLVDVTDPEVRDRHVHDYAFAAILASEAGTVTVLDAEVAA